MPNDFNAINNGIGRLIQLGQPDVVLPIVAPQNFVNVAQVNQLGFDEPPPGPINQQNLGNINQVQARFFIQPLVDDPLHSISLNESRGSGMPKKIVFTYTCGDYSLSEVWYSEGDVTKRNLSAYIDRRLAMSGPNTRIVRARVSQVGAAQRYLSYPVSELLAAPDAIASAIGSFGQVAEIGQRGKDVGSDIANTCMNVLCRNTVDATSRQRRIFMRGFPDSIVEEGGKFVDNGGWSAVFRRWAQYVSATLQWGWMGQANTRPVRRQITALTNVGGLLTITAAGDLFAQVGGQWLNTPVRLTGLPQPFGFLNGAMVVTPTSTTIATCIRNMPFPPGSNFTAGPGKIYITTAPTFFGAQSIALGDPGKRDAGNFQPKHRGRAKNRVWS